MHGCLLEVLCVVHVEVLRRADPSSRVLPSLCVTECDQMQQSSSAATMIRQEEAGQINGVN